MLVKRYGIAQTAKEIVFFVNVAIDTSFFFAA